MPAVPLLPSHPDFQVLDPIVRAILRQAGGWDAFAQDIPQIIRKSIDEVIDTPRTNRFILAETEKTEKTYLGTKIEILLRAHLKLPKGTILDLSVDGTEVDIKNTMGSNWTIPTEAGGHPCLLLKENETTARCHVGIIVAKGEYLNPGQNRDAKRTFSATGIANTWWLLRNHPYPANYWEVMPVAQRHAIMAAGGGTARLAALFRAVQGRPISRLIVQAVAQQHDYMKRIRRNGGARDLLAPEGIALLWGQNDAALITRLGLGPVGPDEFISYQPVDPQHADLLRRAGQID